jgi:broad specificity phosphatase PhoE
MNTPAIWMRHGTCSDAWQHPDAHARPNSPLHPHGVTEVTATVTTLLAQDWRPTLIVTSPLPRARTSADVAAAILGLTATHSHDVLREWAAPRCVLGRSSRHYPPHYRAWQEARLHDVDATLPGGESLRAVRDRAAAAHQHINNLTKQHGPILVVSHRILIGCVAAITEGILDPAEIFTRARESHLAHAGLWRHRRQPDLV